MRDPFSFVDEQESGDLAGWLSFTQTRASRRQQRQERLHGRLRLVGVLLVAALLATGLSVWSPWSSPPDPDTGDAFLGGDRATVLLAVAGRDGTALLSALVVHDREHRRGSVVAVPTELVLPVTGEGRMAVGAAVGRAGPTLTSEAVGDALGVRVDGSWVLPQAEFARFVERLGGLEVAVDRQPLGGAQAVRYAAHLPPGEDRTRRTQQVLGALAASSPKSFTGTRDLLRSLGVLGDSGVTVDRLAAVLSGLARDAAAGRLAAGALPVDPGTQGLHVARAATLVRDMLGGRPRMSLGDVTPRVMVQLPRVDRELAAEVRASLLNGGYEYLDGGSSDTYGRSSLVTVRPDVAGARPVGEAVALTLGLDRNVVRESGSVPVVADVLVVLGSDFGP
jgi:hypothetical protein